MVQPSQGVHLVVDADFLQSDHALLVPRTDDGRVLFAVPWLGATLLGTTDTPRRDLPLEPEALHEEVEFILRESAKYLRRAPQRADVRSVWVGMRPLVRPDKEDGADTGALSREHSVRVSRSGLVTVTGGKWTTYRPMAEDVLARCVAGGLLPPLPPCATAHLTLVGAQAGGPPVSAAPGLHGYGSEAETVQALPGAGRWLWSGRLSEAMVRFAVRHGCCTSTPRTWRRMMTAEQGKPLAEGARRGRLRRQLPRVVRRGGRRVYGETIPTTDPDKRYWVCKQPIGVCAAITPWNFPVAMITRKVAPALAAGCTGGGEAGRADAAVALALAELAQRAGMPDGVLNVVTGRRRAVGRHRPGSCAPARGAPPLLHRQHRGRRILMAQCAPTIKKLALELGGNAPFIVFDDADIDAAVEGAMVSKYRNAGQTCVCANRLYVQDGVYEAFVEKLAARAAQLRVGNGAEAGVQQGPLIDAEALAKVEAHVPTRWRRARAC
jgi:hypothetical protein